MTTRIANGIEILSSRIFSVPLAGLYAAFAEPRLLERWWGPDGFTNRITRFDLEPGGEWHVTMTNSEGVDFHNRSTFELVEPMHRIRYVHHEPMHVFTMDMHFAPSGNESRLTWQMVLERNAESLALRKFIAAANEQNFNRLADVLANVKEHRDD